MAIHLSIVVGDSRETWTLTDLICPRCSWQSVWTHHGAANHCTCVACGMGFILTPAPRERLLKMQWEIRQERMGSDPNVVLN